MGKPPSSVGFMMTQRCLFIGGPRDGLRMSVSVQSIQDGVAIRFQDQSWVAAAGPKFFEYRPMSLRGNSGWHVVYVCTTVTGDPMQLLIDNYRPLK